MSENIFTSETPSTGDDAGGGTNRVLGVVFKASVSGTIDAIRWYGPSTPPSGTASGHLFSMANPNDTSGTLLGSQNFASITGGTWNTATFSSPISISANVPYCAQIFTGDHYCYSGGGLWGSDFTNVAGHLTVYAASSSNNGRFKNVVASATEFPNNTSGGGFNFFVDVVFTVVSTVNGTATLMAAGSLTAPATQLASSALTSGGSLSSPATQPAIAALTAAGSLSAKVRQSVTASLAGVGLLAIRSTATAASSTPAVAAAVASAAAVSATTQSTSTVLGG